MAAVPSAVMAVPQADTASSAAGKCPRSSSCYIDIVKPFIPVVACKWDCGKRVPPGCKQRCKPCHAEVCPAICNCEIQCNIFGPCTATIPFSAADSNSTVNTLEIPGE
ncbi:hypothetical protein IWW55_000829 [Coemansia sp. RSA 2706]|nr:hypothetical protein IWW55_000829 [Coemansia sp. RSA 2706]KAJ2310501.1 hypothetical protein IWW54_003159 [Coemansia sp. RSA 2705]KAJ2321027.1 hypothetical protein IWW52_000996 [Coemansia sp. RSA 2704]KAJ2329141.1 hypothetical protein IWW51_000777 [Coemansia sp. RSA 2702]KAJ2370069.1 hypothetical protein H4S01_000612 [Coemansia sp. RSA 2610]KAJ2389336.1 hypothetical protein H4S02_002413 [Coemansia sp. RSA 2611]KAJ2738721.1 hypothetical protein H4R23_000958 [Coemansia sp. Cherry 401B]